ncbi:CRISPR-associated ring nuclease Csm6 [Conchiformibius kuhniae]|uniref:CRISPR-associated ring nuclease Csm6 n=1 Tax=Conchiformibius kuhniae TaxID=211502 RepID=A0ABD8B8C1_9NEIS|nr:CRISPR-associated ring nuclease Csm6 [Conchiformibius kuhniae]
MKKKILVAVTGMSPQIVTETVYALHRYHGWLPEKIIVLTTLTGRAQIVAKLLGDDGHFARLRRDYGLPPIAFGSDTIRVIHENGRELDDIRTPEQNQAAADLIVREIGSLCRDADTELHVSIAGGRKSMGFYIGYALSLFGRVQDKLSHVLVEEPFEQCPDFFYPAPESRLLRLRDGSCVDAAHAKVMLAEIPFVRMADNPTPLLADAQHTFSQAVQLAQHVVGGRARVRIDAAERAVYIGGYCRIGDLNPMQFALYLAMAQFRKAGFDIHIADVSHRQRLSERYFHHYCRYGEGLQGSHKAAADRRRAVWDDLQHDDGAEIVRILREHRSRINKILKKHLGQYGKRFGIESGGANNRKFYRLQVSAEQIDITGLPPCVSGQ